MSKQQPCLEIHLETLLSEIAQRQGELLEIEETKRRALTERDGEALAALHAREKEAIECLQACARRRAHLLESASKAGHPAESLTQLADRLASRQSSQPGETDSAQLRSLLRTAREMAVRLRQKTFTNWVLAHRTFLHIHQVLELLASGGSDRPTYGGPASTGGGGSVLDQEV